MRRILNGQDMRIRLDVAVQDCPLMSLLVVSHHRFYHVTLPFPPNVLDPYGHPISGGREQEQQGQQYKKRFVFFENHHDAWLAMCVSASNRNPTWPHPQYEQESTFSHVAGGLNCSEICLSEYSENAEHFFATSLMWDREDRVRTATTRDKMVTSSPVETYSEDDANTVSAAASTLPQVKTAPRSVVSLHRDYCVHERQSLTASLAQVLKDAKTPLEEESIDSLVQLPLWNSTPDLSQRLVDAIRKEEDHPEVVVQHDENLNARSKVPSTPSFLSSVASATKSSASVALSLVLSPIQLASKMFYTDEDLAIQEFKRNNPEAYAACFDETEDFDSPTALEAFKYATQEQWQAPEPQSRKDMLRKDQDLRFNLPLARDCALLFIQSISSHYERSSYSLGLPLTLILDDESRISRRFKSGVDPSVSEEPEKGNELSFCDWIWNQMQARSMEPELASLIHQMPSQQFRFLLQIVQTLGLVQIVKRPQMPDLVVLWRPSSSEDNDRELVLGTCTTHLDLRQRQYGIEAQIDTCTNKVMLLTRQMLHIKQRSGGQSNQDLLSSSSRPELLSLLKQKKLQEQRLDQELRPQLDLVATLLHRVESSFGNRTMVDVLSSVPKTLRELRSATQLSTNVDDLMDDLNELRIDEDDFRDALEVAANDASPLQREEDDALLQELEGLIAADDELQEPEAGSSPTSSLVFPVPPTRPPSAAMRRVDASFPGPSDAFTTMRQDGVSPPGTPSFKRNQEEKFSPEDSDYDTGAGLASTNSRTGEDSEEKQTQSFE
jgi:Snf7